MCGRYNERRLYYHDNIYRLDTICKLYNTTCMMKIVQNALQGRPLGLKLPDLAHGCFLGVSEQNSSLSLEMKESIAVPCLQHEAVAELGNAVEFQLLGFNPESNLMYTSLKLKISKGTRSLLVAPQRIHSASSFRRSKNPLPCDFPSTYSWCHLEDKSRVKERYLPFALRVQDELNDPAAANIKFELCPPHTSHHYEQQMRRPLKRIYDLSSATSPGKHTTIIVPTRKAKTCLLMLQLLILISEVIPVGYKDA
ncbi:hypothetical protein AVEN_4820-1 [Araneus ventricosus]|uniref:Uncharacterized protein n=1 Tax=Araneus ventricosus TaxID=182803 RepID=A0A4Y2GD59_ARAVE|nr:hypothetical protein AVEN_4820-1 [Araneus ventricosus]